MCGTVIEEVKDFGTLQKDKRGGSQNVSLKLKEKHVLKKTEEFTKCFRLTFNSTNLRTSIYPYL